MSAAPESGESNSAVFKTPKVTISYARPGMGELSMYHNHACMFHIMDVAIVFAIFRVSYVVSNLGKEVYM